MWVSLRMRFWEGKWEVQSRGSVPGQSQWRKIKSLFNAACHTSYSWLHSQTVMTLTGTLNRAGAGLPSLSAVSSCCTVINKGSKETGKSGRAFSRSVVNPEGCSALITAWLHKLFCPRSQGKTFATKGPLCCTLCAQFLRTP